MPNGEKTVGLLLQNLKFILRVDILFQLNEFIMNGLPKYDSRFELPAKFEADPGKYSAYEFKLCLKDSIVCFE